MIYTFRLLYIVKMVQKILNLNIFFECTTLLFSLNILKIKQNNLR